ncbi:MAG TPA: hypothetical protein VGQ75_07255 [Thermoanaerobaculia bacterium]|nr:hypothetical protein [Thermoanaerobaculia bacterium]
MNGFDAAPTTRTGPPGPSSGGGGGGAAVVNDQMWSAARGFPATSLTPLLPPLTVAA